MGESVIIRPHPGPQEQFLSCSADIAIYGGSAGAGKSWALLLDPLRHVDNKEFGAVCFRRTSPQITNEGGLWDESKKLYFHLDAKPFESTPPYWRFPSKSTISFAHLQLEKTVYDWQGAQVAWIGFDELTHFTEKQFFYMLSRNRSTCGIQPYMRATCNADADSWVADFIAWWIDQETGYAIPERSGVVRYFVRANDVINWADTREELQERFPGIPAKSMTFIAAKLEDNPTLLRIDPGYLANLMAQSRTERERLLDGNWKIKTSSGQVFRGVERCVTDRLGAPVELRQPYPSTFVMGVDWGRKEDYTVLTVMDCATQTVVDWDRFDKIDWIFQRQRLKAMAEKWGCFVINAEENAMGDVLIQELRRDDLPVIGWYSTHQTKTELIQRLSLKIEQGDIFFPDISPLVNELIAFEISKTPTGMIKYAAPEGQHDDCVISLALAAEVAAVVGRDVSVRSL